MDSMGEDRRNNERDVDQWLDTALGEYGRAEPRAGLQSRVLAGLQAERNRIASQRRWWWAVGTAAAAAVAIAVWVGEGRIRKTPPTTARTSTTHRENAGASRKPTTQSPVTQQAKEVVRHPGAKPTMRDVAAVNPPKLEQFPSPAPLNEQEKMLARYVAEFPQRAALVARAQADLRKRDEREMTAPWPKSAESTSSDQQE